MKVGSTLPKCWILAIVFFGSMAAGPEARAQAPDNNLEFTWQNDNNNPVPYDYQTYNVYCNNFTDPSTYGCYPGESGYFYVNVDYNAVIMAGYATLPPNSPYQIPGCSDTTGVCPVLSLYVSIQWSCEDGSNGDAMFNLASGSQQALCPWNGNSPGTVASYDVIAWVGKAF
jgi:hypothetical protein